jgi:hypothetical protein
MIRTDLSGILGPCEGESEAPTSIEIIFTGCHSNPNLASLRILRSQDVNRPHQAGFQTVNGKIRTRDDDSVQVDIGIATINLRF